MPDCPCVGKHIPKVMKLSKHYIWPLESGGPDTPSNTLTLCPTTHFNIEVLWGLYDQHEGRPPWSVLRGYSEFAREVVERGRELRRRTSSNSNSNSETVRESSTFKETISY